jgi:hypothetical protein
MCKPYAVSWISQVQVSCQALGQRATGPGSGITGGKVAIAEQMQICWLIVAD